MENQDTQTLPHSDTAEAQRMTGYDVLDKNDHDVGNVTAIWTDRTGRPAFIGVRTFWVVGRTHVVPGYTAEVNHPRKHIRLPFTDEDVKNAPTFDPDADLTLDDERKILDYYRTRGAGLPEFQPEAERAQTEAPARPQPESAEHAEEARIPLHEEELEVGKRRVEAGGIRLRKIIRTETVQQPVDLKREEIQVERVPAGESRLAEGEKAFEGEDIYIPVYREEAVAQKTTRVTGEVRARKTEETEQQTVSGEVRKEEVDVEDQRRR